MSLSNAILLLVTFNYIFGPRLKMADMLLYISLFLSVCGLIYSYFIKRRLEWTLVYYVAMYMVITLYSLIVVAWYDYRDLTSVALGLKSIMYFFAAYILVMLYKIQYAQDFPKKLCRDIFFCGVVNSVIVILVFVFDPLRNVLIDLLDFSSTQQEWAALGRRAFDISMGGGASGSIVFSIIFYLGFIMFLNSKKSFNIMLGLITVFVATVLTGRTGLVFIIFLVPLIAFIKRSNVNQREGEKIKKVSIIKVGLSLTLVLCSILITFYAFPSTAVERFENVILPWALEYYYSYENTGVIRTQSTDILSEMLIFPDTTGELLFGTSNFGRSNDLIYIPSDIGYVRLLFGVGIVGTIMHLLPIFYTLILGWSEKKKNILYDGLFFCSVVFLIGNIKELFVAPRGGASILFLLATAAVLISITGRDQHG